MPQSLAQRISEQFEAHERKKQQAAADRERQAKVHEARLEQFAKRCDELKAVWRPRLEEFIHQFGERIDVKPSLTPTHREARVHFKSHMATMTLTLTVSPSADASRLVIDYDLLVIPVYFQYERHAVFETPIDQVEPDVVGQWLDDRLVSCVETYLAVQDNELYVQRAMVEDPITRVRFMREDAVATLVHNRQTQHFASEQTLQDYAAKHELSIVADPVTGDRLIRDNAAATIEHDGETYYFVSKETTAAFKDGRGITS